MELNKATSGLLEFINKSPSSFHAIKNIKDTLNNAGYTELFESDKWVCQPGGKYYVTRNSSSIIAFRVPEEFHGGFMITASHSDSPTFKVKSNAEMDGPENYVRINTERYGGMILDSWFDRPLSVAGRVIVRDGDGGLASKLVYVDRDLLMIPHVAVHMLNPNNGMTYNPASDLVPLYALSNAKGSFIKVVAEAAGVDPSDILEHELYLVNRQPQSVWGAENEFISSPKLDDLQCAYSSFASFIESNTGSSIPVLYISDNEEVGCVTKQGAGSTFLYDTLTRINAALGGTPEDYLRLIASSMLLSADNAHAVHPNHAELADPTHRPRINGGIVMKYSAAQLYMTDAISAALFDEICRIADVPLQKFFNRSDIRGGSTLGVASTRQVAINTVDIGIAQFAMHSSYETAGSLDTEYMVRAMKVFYESTLEMRGDSIKLK
ncbi:MAG: M18 family aminopeptidase [Clostridiales bacterium]|nr:M18 family aminopeptidase [Clostridiales bacterium]